MHCDYRNSIWYGIAAGIGEIALFYFLELFTPLDFSGWAHIAVMFAMFSCMFLPVPIRAAFCLPKLKRSGVNVEAEVLSTKIEGEGQNIKRNKMYVSTIRFALDDKTFIKRLYNFTIYRSRIREGERLNVIVNPDNTDNYLVIPRGRVFIIINAVFGIIFQVLFIAAIASGCVTGK